MANSNEPRGRENAMRRLGVVLATTATSMLMIGGVASAHECFIENRSDKGDAQAAAHSQRWDVVTVQMIAGFVAEEVPGLDTDCFVDFWLDNGGPASITVHTGHTIGGGSSNPNTANGKGLEHAIERFEGLVGGAIGACT